MNDQLTKEDIKNSVEVLWRKHQIKSLFMIWLFVFTIIFVGSATFLVDKYEYLYIIFLILLGYFLFLGLIFGSFMLYYAFKIRYIMKNYLNFSVHKVFLSEVSTSYMYRGSIYFTVQIEVGNYIKNVNTNPCFSSFIFEKFPPRDYVNSEVIGLYDEQLDKFYIVKKID